jgi:hypothetical protein
MPFASGYVAIIAVAGTDISQFTEKVSASVKRADHQLPRLGGFQIARLVGPPQTELKLNGWFDPIVDGVLFPLAIAPIPTLQAISYTPQGTTGPTHTGTGYLLDYDSETDAKNPGTWTATIVVDGNWA